MPSLESGLDTWSSKESKVVVLVGFFSGAQSQNEATSTIFCAKESWGVTRWYNSKGYVLTMFSVHMACQIARVMCSCSGTCPVRFGVTTTKKISCKPSVFYLGFVQQVALLKTGEGSSRCLPWWKTCSMKQNRQRTHEFQRYLNYLYGKKVAKHKSYETQQLI